MSKPPLPEAAVAMLRKPNPAVITTLRPDGQPVATATWYLWDDGRVLVNMDEGRKRLEHIRNDPRVALDVLDEGGWGTHVSIIGHIDETREDTGLADIDRIARQYIGRPYPQRGRRRISAWIAVDGWHGWGALKDNSQAAGLSDYMIVLEQPEPGVPRMARGSLRAIADHAKSALGLCTLWNKSRAA
jgi:PPOX class probable F420-dependent enzyme